MTAGVTDNPEQRPGFSGMDLTLHLAWKDAWLVLLL